MLSLFSSKRPKTPTPSWLRWAMLGFVALALLNGYRSETGLREGAAIKDYPVLSEFVSLGHWQSVLDPSAGKGMEVQQLRAGTGDVVDCGQRVTLRIKAVEMQDVALPRSFVLPEAAVSFTIGDASQHPILDRGVRGMRRGEVRQLLAGARWIDEAAPLDLRYPFEVELLEVAPYLAKPEQFEAAFIQVGEGVPALCGEKVAFRLIQKGNLEPFDGQLELGKGFFGHGIDRALIGMRPNASKDLRVPMEYLPSDTSVLPWKLEQNLLAQITRLPYIEPLSTSPIAPKEPAQP